MALGGYGPRRLRPLRFLPLAVTVLAFPALGGSVECTFPGVIGRGCGVGRSREGRHHWQHMWPAPAPLVSHPRWTGLPWVWGVMGLRAVQPAFLPGGWVLCWSTRRCSHLSAAWLEWEPACFAVHPPSQLTGLRSLLEMLVRAPCLSPPAVPGAPGCSGLC